jgi:hypothetical protein
MRNARSFLDWIRAISASKLAAQMKGDVLMLLPEIADGFRVSISTLRSLDEREGLSFDTFSLPEDECVPVVEESVQAHARKRN